MTTSEPTDPEEPSDGEPGPDHDVDVDAAFAEIVAHWEPSGDPEPEPEEPADRQSLQKLFRPVWQEEPGPAPQPDSDEDHYVPPPPPPLPQVEPGRKVAWAALFGVPLLALLLLFAGLPVPRWVPVGLVVAFVAGFGYLVATMGSSPKSRPDDDWPGDDGAVI